MNLSQFIAPEHLHALVAHFPVVLTLVGTLFYLASFLSTFRWLEQSALALGFLGVATGFLAKFTGQKAAEIVGPKLCKANLLAVHAQETESAVVFFAVAFSVAILFYIAKTKFFPRLLTFTWIKALISLGLILGTVFMCMGAYKGFLLVYTMGAGVSAPNTVCVPGS